MKPHPKIAQKESFKRRRVDVRRLREDCVEFVSVVFNFTDKDRTKTWNLTTEMRCFSCPACGGEGHVKCDECNGKGERRGGKWCVTCEGMGATGCDDCEDGTIPNWPTRNIVYPLPDDFDRPDALTKATFGYVIVVKIGTLFFLAYAIPERPMRSMADMPVAMIEAYITLGYLPPAQLVCRLLDGNDLPGRGVLVQCRRSLSVCSRRWARRLVNLDKATS